MFTFLEVWRGTEVIWGALEKEAGEGATGSWGALRGGKALDRDGILWILSSLSDSDSAPLKDVSGTAEATGQAGATGYYKSSTDYQGTTTSEKGQFIITSIFSLLRGNELL